MLERTKRLSKEETMELIKNLDIETKKADGVNVPLEALLPLIALADSLHIDFPKTSAITYAYKLGYSNSIAQQNCSETKKKFIELISAMESEAAIDYFYHFTLFKLQGTEYCPEQFQFESSAQNM